mgnify:CR=1
MSKPLEDVLQKHFNEMAFFRTLFAFLNLLVSSTIALKIFSII